MDKPNAHSAPTILTKIPSEFNEGAYATVFFIGSGPGRHAVKVFKRKSDAPDGHVNSVFQSENAALRKANETPALRDLVPHHYGALQIGQILNEQGRDVTAEYHTEMNYEMEFVPGNFRKIGVTASEGERIKSLFRAAGINHMSDASVILNDSNKIEKVVDFALKEFELEW